MKETTGGIRNSIKGFFDQNMSKLGSSFLLLFFFAFSTSIVMGDDIRSFCSDQDFAHIGCKEAPEADKLSCMYERRMGLGLLVTEKCAAWVRANGKAAVEQKLQKAPIQYTSAKDITLDGNAAIRKKAKLILRVIGFDTGIIKVVDENHNLIEISFTAQQKELVRKLNNGDTKGFVFIITRADEYIEGSLVSIED